MSKSLTDFGELLEPTEAAEPILSKPVRSALLEWLTEIWAADELTEAGLKPRQRALFSGLPGTGKTTLAHHLAARLGLSMLVVRPETLINKYLGETASNIGKLFAAAGTADPPVILFMDEFDALAIKRKAAETGAEEERNSWVNTLLQRIEQHDGFIITATNFAAHLDTAIWRRFDLQIEIDLPGPFERERILERYLDPWGLPPAELKAMAEALSTASPALIRQFAESVKRQLIIGPKVGWEMSRNATIGRVLAAIQPHPDLGKPRLWSLGIADAAVRALPWPLPRRADLDATPSTPPAIAAADNVTPFPKAAGA